PVYLLLLLVIILSSCFPSRLSYVGSKHTPTNKVDVYVDEGAIKRKYVIIGKGYVEPGFHRRDERERLLNQAIVKARKNGADAVFYRETFIPTPAGTTIQTYSKTDSI